MSNMPDSFDPLLLEDQLMATLKQSPLTSQLVSLRAEEIVQQVLEKPACVLLERKLVELKEGLRQ